MAYRHLKQTAITYFLKNTIKAQQHYHLQVKTLVKSQGKHQTARSWREMIFVAFLKARSDGAAKKDLLHSALKRNVAALV